MKEFKREMPQIKSVVKDNFVQIILLNLMYVLIYAVPFALLYYLIGIFIPEVFLDLLSGMFVKTNGLTGIQVSKIFTATVLCAFTCCAAGPLQAGFSFIYRNISIGREYKLLRDLKEKIKGNLMQGLSAMILDYITVIFIMFAASYIFKLSGILSTVLLSVVLMMLILYILNHFFLYTMIVTFGVTMKQLIKNSFLLSMIKILPGIIKLALCIVVLIVLYSMHPYFGMAVSALFYFSFVNIIMNRHSWPLFFQYMVENSGNKNEDSKSLTEEKK